MIIAVAANRAASHLGLTSMGFAVVLAAGCSAPIEGDGVVAITNVNVITMVGDEILFDHTVLLAGAGAYSDVAKAAPPMLALALGTKLFPFISKSKRGLALLIASAAAGAVIVGLAV